VLFRINLESAVRIDRYGSKCLPLQAFEAENSRTNGTIHLTHQRC
jgi:hypothetical protein